MNAIFDKYPWNAIPYDPEMMACVRLGTKEAEAIDQEIKPGSRRIH
ncbi:hypothetical protein [Mesorhizobium sp. ANAO-SY3R2]